MSDSIHLQGIRVWGKHGADPGEQDAAQPFDLDVILTVDLRVPQASDNLADTVDYSAVYQSIVRIVQTTSYSLLECLAGEIMEAIFADARIESAQITIAKPGLLGGATPAVTLRRENRRK